MPDHGHIGLHTLSRHSGVHIQRPGSQSPPLPPPPPPEEHADFGRPRTAQQQAAAQIAAIVPDDQNLPGWVPKNYMEKGTVYSLIHLFLIECNNSFFSRCHIRLLCRQG